MQPRPVRPRGPVGGERSAPARRPALQKSAREQGGGRTAKRDRRSGPAFPRSLFFLHGRGRPARRQRGRAAAAAYRGDVRPLACLLRASALNCLRIDQQRPVAFLRLFPPAAYRSGRRRPASCSCLLSRLQQIRLMASRDPPAAAQAGPAAYQDGSALRPACGRPHLGARWKKRRGSAPKRGFTLFCHPPIRSAADGSRC